MYFIIFKGIGDMTTKQVAVLTMTDDDFPKIPQTGDQVTQFVLCRMRWQINPH